MSNATLVNLWGSRFEITWETLWEPCEIPCALSSEVLEWETLWDTLSDATLVTLCGALEDIMWETLWDTLSQYLVSYLGRYPVREQPCEAPCATANLWDEILNEKPCEVPCVIQSHLTSGQPCRMSSMKSNNLSDTTFGPCEVPGAIWSEKCCDAW